MAELARPTWTLTVEACVPWLTSNKRGRYAIAQLVRVWRRAAYEAARVAKLPTGLDRVRIDLEARFRGPAPVRDRMNLYPTVKAVIDGLGPSRVSAHTPHAVGWGLIPDDDDTHLDGPHLSIGPRLPDAPYATHGHLLVTITDLSGGSQ